MLRDVVHARVVPYRVGVVLGRNELERRHRQPGLLGCRYRGGGVVVCVFEGQQETRRIDAGFEDVAHAGRITRDVVDAAGDEEHRRLDPGQAGRVPESGIPAPRRDGHRSLDAFVHRSGMGRIAGLAHGECTVGRAPGQRDAGGREAAADGIDNAVAAHRVTDQPGGVGVDHALERTGRVVGIQPGHFIEHKQLVQRAVQQRAAKCRLVAVGAVGVVDRHHHIALARQVLAQMAEQVTVARITVRNDQQRVGAAGGIRWRVAHGPAVQRDFTLAVACNGPVLAGAGLARHDFGRVPDFDRQGPVVGRNRFAGLGLEDIELLRVGHLQRLHADAELAVLRQFRRVRTDRVYMVVLCLRRTAQADQSRKTHGHCLFQHVSPLVCRLLLAGARYRLMRSRPQLPSPRCAEHTRHRHGTAVAPGSSRGRTAQAGGRAARTGR